MPTPSSRREREAVSLNSTCPDEPPTARAPAEQYEETAATPSRTSAAAASQPNRTDDDARLSGLADHQTQYTTDESQSPYTQPSPVMSPNTPHSDGDDHSDAADKQSEADSTSREAGSASAYIRGPIGDLGDRGDRGDGRVYSRSSPIVRPHHPRAANNRDVARYSMPEPDTWHAGSSHGARLGQSINRSTTRADTAGYSMSNGSRDDDEEDEDEEALSYVGWDPTSLRVIPSCPNRYLRPGSRFVGTQQSERQVYDVQVELKYVDLRESFLCGYLRIQGLTEDHPTLTTYFEGEIIGSKYGFTTKHPAWGANERIDMSHWAKFPAFQLFKKPAGKSSLVLIREQQQNENVFMRWKEHFLVPNHRVRTIHGASFEGFYYICFNQIQGVVHGIYFHSKSEKFQQLELNHVEDKGCRSAVELR